jgi:hypothetical protein
MPTKLGSPKDSGANDLIHTWVMDRPFSAAAWSRLTTAAKALTASGITFGPAPRDSLRLAPLVFSVTCGEHTITLRGAGFMALDTHRVWLGGDELVIHRFPGGARGAINTAGRPYEPVVRALLAMAVHFGAGFRIISTASDRQDWHETECLVSGLLGADVSGIHPDDFAPPFGKPTPPAGPLGAWAVPARWMHRPSGQARAAA